jgi:hypothetical protein
MGLGLASGSPGPVSDSAGVTGAAAAGGTVVADTRVVVVVAGRVVVGIVVVGREVTTWNEAVTPPPQVLPSASATRIHLPNGDGAGKLPEISPVAVCVTVVNGGKPAKFIVTPSLVAQVQPVPEKLTVSPGVTTVGLTVSVGSATPDASTAEPSTIRHASPTTQDNHDSPRRQGTT